MERVILPDCCEDWMLEYGAFYPEGAEFACIECGTEWRKLGAGRFKSRSSGNVWTERARTAEGREFRYLEAESGEGAITDRCCARLILEHGPRIRTGTRFTCPVSGTTWRKETISLRSGLQVAGYTDEARGVTMTVQAGEGRNFLVPIDEYRAPRNE